MGLRVKILTDHIKCDVSFFFKSEILFRSNVGFRSHVGFFKCSFFMIIKDKTIQLFKPHFSINYSSILTTLLSYQAIFFLILSLLIGS